MTRAQNSGRLITFEGGEGVGKSTQSTTLARHLEAIGHAATTTREPGGSPFAEHLRSVILDPATPAHSPLAEALLFAAARSDHLETTIRPALCAGRWVICDRFMDSTRAYQGAAGGLTADIVGQLETIVVGDTRPDLTIVLDLPVELAFQRVAARSTSPANVARAATGDDRYEARAGAFHERLRRAFLEIARSDPARCVVVDASGAADEIAATIWRLVSARLLDGAP